MKIIRKDGVVFDTKDEAVTVVFQNDAERIKVANDLFKMKRSDGKRLYCTFPDTKYTDTEIREFMNECNEL